MYTLWEQKQDFIVKCFLLIYLKEDEKAFVIGIYEMLSQKRLWSNRRIYSLANLHRISYVSGDILYISQTRDSQFDEYQSLRVDVTIQGIDKCLELKRELINTRGVQKVSVNVLSLYLSLPRLL